MSPAMSNAPAPSGPAPSLAFLTRHQRDLDAYRTTHCDSDSVAHHTSEPDTDVNVDPDAVCDTYHYFDTNSDDNTTI